MNQDKYQALWDYINTLLKPAVDITLGKKGKEKILSILQSIQPQMSGRTCEWHPEGTLMSGMEMDAEHWETSCEKDFDHFVCSPSEQEFIYCPFCGGKIVEKG